MPMLNPKPSRFTRGIIRNTNVVNQKTFLRITTSRCRFINGFDGDDGIVSRRIEIEEIRIIVSWIYVIISWYRNGIGIIIANRNFQPRCSSIISIGSLPSFQSQFKGKIMVQRQWFRLNPSINSSRSYPHRSIPHREDMITCGKKRGICIKFFCNILIITIYPVKTFKQRHKIIIHTVRCNGGQFNI